METHVAHIAKRIREVIGGERV
ncbi:protein of unknown function [Serratia sp. Tan611]|nr:protein of unknown function [Serratia sp. Tan611]